MISPHSLFLILVPLIALLSFAFYRLRPRSFMKSVRWIDERSGGAIILLGLTVLICGCLGFSRLEKAKSNVTYDVSLSLNADGQQAEGDNDQQPKISGSLQSAIGNQTTVGTARVQENNSAPKETTSLAGAIYETFQIFAFNIDHEVLEQSFLLRVAMISAVLLATIIASKGIAILFHSSYEALGLRFKSKHVVVCGLGRIGRQLLADLEAMRSEFQVVVIEPDPENKNIAWAREMGAVVLIGDATRAATLEDARVYRAREVFVVTGSDECNIESVIEIRDILQRKGRIGRWGQKLPKLRCHVHILNKNLAEIVREKTLLLERMAVSRVNPANDENEPDSIDVEVFNALERTARRLLEDIAVTVQQKGSERRTSSKSAEKPSKQVLHYFLFGFGEFGQTLALKLAELSHFPACTRNRMSIFDTKIEERAAAFVARYPGFGPALDRDKAWEFDSQADDWESTYYRPGPESRLPDNSPGIEYVCNSRFVEYRDIADDSMLQKMIKCCQDDSVQPILLVCFEEDRDNFARAERLRSKLNSLGKDWQIFVWIPRQRELSQLLSEHRRLTSGLSKEKCQLLPFGQCYGSVSYSEINNSWMDWLARHFHLVWMDKNNRFWTSSIERLQNALRDPNGSAELVKLNWEEIDAVAKEVWESCSEWERASNRSCAVHSVLKVATLGLRIIGFSTQPIETPIELSVTPQINEKLRVMEHYRWVSERLLAGWRYDEKRSNIRKTRWQIVPWSKLVTPPAGVKKESQAQGKAIDERMKDQAIVVMLFELIKLGLLKTTKIAN